jgi:hypothetical protein
VAAAADSVAAAVDPVETRSAHPASKHFYGGRGTGWGRNTTAGVGLRSRSGCPVAGVGADAEQCDFFLLHYLLQCVRKDRESESTVFVSDCRPSGKRAPWTVGRGPWARIFPVIYKLLKISLFINFLFY